MMTLLTVVQVLLAIAMIAIILVQRGPGASAGSGFGAGASATVFGSRGSGSFLTRTTAILATVFFAISFLMAVLVSRTVEPEQAADLGVMAGAVEESEQPAEDGDVPMLSTRDDQDVPVMPTEEGDEVQEVPTGPVDPARDSAAEEDNG